jgi:hypothetical protein
MLVGLLSISVQALAANAVMTGNDTNSATTSFNSDVQLKWNPAGAPSAGNAYSTNGYLMRTPSTTGSYTFAGDSLTVGRGANPVGTAGYSADAFNTNGVNNNNSLMNKTPTGAGVTITVNNLILDAGSIRDGMGSADVWTLAGNIYVTANGGAIGNQCRLNVASVLSGSGNLYINDAGNTDVNRATWINSSQNTYNGSIKMVGQAANKSRLNFADDSRMNFVIGLSGINNSVYGTGTAAFNGDFYFDLSGASTNFGDSWTIASVTAQTFGSTFTVAGFTNTAASNWRTTANGANYLFSTTTGILKVVPEPATMMLLGLGSLALLRKKR